MRDAACRCVLLPRSARRERSCAGRRSPGLQNIGHELAREVAREAVEGGRLLLKERGELARDLILLTEGVVLTVVERVAGGVSKRDAQRYGHGGSRGASGGGVIRKRRDDGAGDNA